MTWGWTARGELPLDASATGTTGGGTRGGVADAGKTEAWPRYEAEYLKRQLNTFDPIHRLRKMTLHTSMRGTSA